MNSKIALAFFLSGFAGLMHEIVWSKLLATLIGTTAHAQAAVLVVYMGGLALGSVLFGHWGDRHGRSLHTYMILEVGIGAYCLALPLFLAVAGSVYVGIASNVFDAPQLRLALRFAMALVTVILPAVLMGGTLPLLARHIIGRPGQARRRVAALYSLNNLGAVLGAAIAGFITLPIVGVYASLAVASAMNLASAALVWPLRGEDGAAARLGVGKTSPGEDAVRSYGESTYTVTLIALFLSGFAAMAYEVVFIRVIALAFGATTYAFTVMLMCFITGIGLGSLAVMRFNIERPLWLLGVSQLVAGVAFLAATPLMERMGYFVALLRIAAIEAGPSFALYQAGLAALCLAVLLLPTMCVGASFPLVAAVQARQPGRIGSLVGTTYACNTLGNVLGVLVTTFVLLRAVGMQGSFHIAVALSLTAGILVLVVAAEATAARRTLAVAGAALAVAIYGARGLDWATPLIYANDHLRLRSGPPPGTPAEIAARHPASRFDVWKEHYVARDTADQTILHLEEEAHANVMVARRGSATRLVVNTKTDASTHPNDLETMLVLGHLPLFQMPQARSLMIVGLGSGLTLGSALRHPIEHVDVVEISEGVIHVAPAFADDIYHALDDARVRIHMDDAQSFLRTAGRRYDVIACQPSNPWISGIAGLFTVEFFETARERLSPGGIFTLWFQEYEQSDEAVRLILRTFQSVFPYVSLFAEENYDDVIAIGTVEPHEFDFAAIEDRFDRPEVRNDLARLGIVNVATLVSHHAVPADVVAREFGVGPVNRELQQRLEYSAIRAMFAGGGSDLIEQNSPLLQDNGPTLLDAYIDYRENVGEPIRLVELEMAAEHMSARSSYEVEHRQAILARAARARDDGEAASRSARGAAPDPARAGYYEAVFWRDHFREAREPLRAAAYGRRASDLKSAGRVLPEDDPQPAENR